VISGIFVNCVGRYRRNAVKYMHEALNFIMSQAGAMEYKGPDTSGENRYFIVSYYGNWNRVDTMYLSDIVSRVRLIHKVFEKKHREIV